MTTSMTRTLAEFVFALDYERLPAPVVDKVKTCVLDAIACACGGSDLPWSKAAVGMAAEHGGKAEASVWIDGGKTGFGYAALANAVMSHSIIQEDMHAETAAHFGSVVIPAAFALGEKLGRSGRDVIVAIVAGYEVMGRIGKAIVSPEFSRRGFRPSGMFGPFGAAAVGAKLWHLDRDQTVLAFGLAGNLASGVNEWANAGTSDIFFHNGFAAHNGLMAAYLVQHGVTAPERIIEGKAGLANAWSGDQGDSAWAMADLGKVFEMERVYHKPAPACAFTQETVQAAQKLVAQYDIAADQIDGITVSAYPMAKLYTGCDYPGPFTSLIQAQMSNQFAVASVIVHGDVNFRHYADFADERVRDIARKITVEIDSEATALFPERKQSKITVRMKDGTSHTVVQRDLDALGHVDIVRKLKVLGTGLFTESRLDEIVAAAAGLERLENLAGMTALLKANGIGRRPV
ncbi:MAG: MmgE/PrpD family protein [Rhodospirillaceae bacterium]|nr:MmgE/PrpD family protein [Rhodospirillaceae bacterium]